MRLLTCVLLLACQRPFEKLSTESVRIDSVSPSAAVRGMGCFVVTGVGLEAAAFRVGGVSATRDSQGRVCVTATTPVGSSLLEVIGPGSTSSRNVTILEGVANVSAVAPVVAAIGQTITLFGSGFDSAASGRHRVRFSGSRIDATVTAALTDRLLVQVPEDALSGAVSLSLSDVDPASGDVSGPSITVVQPFGIDAITPSATFLGQNVVLSLDHPLSESSLVFPPVTVGGVGAAAAPSGTSQLVVTLPSSLLVTPGDVVQACVEGDRSSPCVSVTIKGKGHADLLRSPVCQRFEPQLATGPARFDTSRPEGTPCADPTRGALLDDANDLLYAFARHSSGGLPFQRAFPLPIGAYSKLAVANAFIATFDDDSQTLHVLLTNTGESQSFLVGEPIQTLETFGGDSILLLVGSPASEALVLRVDVVSLVPSALLAEARLPLLVNALAAAAVDPEIRTQWVVAATGGFVFFNADAGTRSTLVTTPRNLQDVKQIAWLFEEDALVLRDDAPCSKFVASIEFFAPDHLSRTGGSDVFLHPACEVGGGGCGASCSGVRNRQTLLDISPRNSLLGGYYLGVWQNSKEVPSNDQLHFAFLSAPTNLQSSIGGKILDMEVQNSGVPCSSGHVCIPGTCFPGYPEPTTVRVGSVGSTTHAVAVANDRIDQFRFVGPTGTVIALGARANEPQISGAECMSATRYIGMSREQGVYRQQLQLDISSQVAALRLGEASVVNAGSGVALRFGSPAPRRVTQWTLDASGDPGRTLESAPFGAIVERGPTGTATLVLGVTGALPRTTVVEEQPSGALSLLPRPQCCDPDSAGCVPTELGSIAVLTQQASVALAATCSNAADDLTCAHDDPLDPAYETPDHPRGGACLSYSATCGAVPLFPKDCRRTGRIFLARPNGGFIATDACGARARILGVFPGRQDDEILVHWQVEHDPAGPTLVSAVDVCPTRPPELTRKMLTLYRLTDSEAVNITGAPAIASPLQVDGPAVRWDSIHRRWLFVAQGALRELGEDFSQRELLPLTTTVRDLQVSADGTRIYVLAGDGKVIRVFDNQALPVFVASASLPEASSQLAVMRDGATVLATIDSGFCSLSD